MELLGVLHSTEYLDDVLKYLEQAHPEGIESLMVELPPEWPQLKKEELVTDGTSFFERIVRKYEAMGVKIIYGDKGRLSTPCLRESPKTFKDRLVEFLLTGLLSPSPHYTDASYLRDRFGNERNEAMAQVVREEKPQVIVVGRAHADYLKSEFPEAHYVAFQPSFRRSPIQSLICRSITRPSIPYKLVTM